MPSKKNIMDYDSVAWDEASHCIKIIDQTQLPYKIEILELRTQEEIWHAIYRLSVRGAPAIGVAAAFGIYLAACEIKQDNYEQFYNAFKSAQAYLDSSRPTAVNLSWALKRMEACLVKYKCSPIQEILDKLKHEAIAIHDEDISVCRRIGEYGLTLVNDGDGILTHCNAGQLACVKYGTATAPVYVGKEQGINLRVFADETRPLLQGARLTAYELHSAGIDVTLICDSMSATVMKNGWVNAVFVGCDRVAANGDTANKIGTSMVAFAAKRYNIPMYICAPTSTIDMSILTGDEIIIEERPAEEITEMWYKNRMAPDNVKVFNPAFDVTDHDLIAGIITEYGIAKPPFMDSLQEIFRIKQSRK